MSPRARRAFFAGVLLIAGAAALLMWRVWAGGAARGELAGETLADDALAPFLIFRTLAPPAAHGRLAVLLLDSPGAVRRPLALSCARVHYAGGRGLCVVQAPDGQPARYAVHTFDRTMTLGPRVDVPGVPTRVRVSPDGRRGAITTYAEEESPAGERLATGALIVDMSTGQVLGDVRQFRIDTRATPELDGPIDVGSVAFEADGDRFFAAVSAASGHYLCAGSVDERRLTGILAGVANEALSPGGRQLAVKMLRDGGFWQLAVIDLRTWEQRELKQGERSVDDQVEWFDEEHVMYHDAYNEGTALWILPADGVGKPRVLVEQAYSGSVQR